MVLFCRTASPVIMKDLLRLFLFSLLFMEGASLECETCTSQTTSCSGKRQMCLPSQDTCITWMTESTKGNVLAVSTTKACSTQDKCEVLKHGVAGWSGKSKTIVKNVQCSKASVSYGSFFLALSGFLLLKLLL
ncbi:phospholipase A2 inhibitor gamma subunit B-like [Sphaerodactylus townsendi]|uniref:phospholipase A2 inhibitor gamma subunit B-like n=1 Tax=Sphaerodactylus townsendi TaxID=933632 RepID=UPI002026D21E|nr:phospholipase A2 inhibitor gamma subunit B-like [Sphaerodactylus townsendi]